MGDAGVEFADPYDPMLRTGRELGLPVHDGGIMVVIEGPRFSTVAESRWYSTMGWSVVNMTSYPEAVLARELEIGYANISLTNDYDAGLAGADDVRPVSAGDVAAVLPLNSTKLRSLLMAAIPLLPEKPAPLCSESLQSSRIVEMHPGAD